jgi:hypothetical protein
MDQMRLGLFFPTASRHLLIVALAFMGQACSEPVDSPAADDPALDAVYIKGAAQWEVIWIVNRQPAYIGAGEQVQEVTYLAQPGQNRVVVKAHAREPSHALPPCQTQMVALNKRNMQETILGGLDILKPEQNVLRKEFSFSYPGKARRTWQLADDITPFAPADKQTITAIVTELQKAFSERDIAAVAAMAYAPWLVDPTAAVGSREDQLQQIRTILENPAYRIAVSAPADLSAAIGTKLVMVYTAHASIISAIPDLADPNYVDQWLQIIDIRRLYFVKGGGRWLVLDFI